MEDVTNRRKAEYFTGCILGGAVGDTLGAPLKFVSLRDIRKRYSYRGLQDYEGEPHITDDTQMTLFTADGLLRAEALARRAGNADVISFVYRSYIRWYRSQITPPAQAPQNDGWISAIQALYVQREPGEACMSALRSGKMGNSRVPINNSKACEGVVRIAPVGLFFDSKKAFEVGCDLAAITHGHPSGYIAAGCLAYIIAEIMAGNSLEGAIQSAPAILRGKGGFKEVVEALEKAYVQASDTRVRPTAELVEKLGGGWGAEEALAISIYCALAAKGDFAQGLILAVNHSGDSNSTGAITGNIMGALLGRRAIPVNWLERLELRQEIETVALDLFVRYEDSPAWKKKYPV